MLCASLSPRSGSPFCSPAHSSRAPGFQRLNGGVCGASGTFSVSVEWVPPRAICTYVRHSRVFEVRHDAPYKDVAGALMAMGLVLAISAFAAPPPPGQNRAMGG